METYFKRGTTPQAQEQSPEHSIADLLRELREETVTLAKQEIALAKTEMKEKASRLTRNAVYMAVGGLVAYAGLIFLLFAGMRGLTAGLIAAGVSAQTALWLSPLIVGVAVALIGMALVLKAKNAFAKEKLVPEKTIQSLKEETSWTRAKIKEA